MPEPYQKEIDHFVKLRKTALDNDNVAEFQILDDIVGNLILLKHLNSPPVTFTFKDPISRRGKNKAERG